MPVYALADRLDELGRVSDEPDRLTRTFLSAAMRRANALVGGWMAAAGLEVCEDAFGNLIGRWPSSRPGARTLLLGSHLDTVRDAGRFDGALGVLLAIAALEELRARGRELPFHVEVLGFSEEEGVRFASAYLGSKGFCGLLTEEDLALRDAEGVSVEEALAAFARGRASAGSPLRLPETSPDLSRLLGYLEVHIEQGPVLETEGLALGVVSAIAGQTRVKLTWTGKAGHAGTTPMALRRDALAGAAELVLAAETLARENPPLVATVGTLVVEPGAANVIPGEVTHSLDVRHPEDGARLTALDGLERAAEEIARRRHLSLAWRPTQDDPAVPCSRDLAAVLAESVREIQGRSVELASGAGHDAVIASRLAPVAMLFVRCRDGLSHHPDEHVEPEDLGLALAATVDFLERLAERERA
ncbi:MAG TPA: allantoate amidohydrolase [Thermoanaerobaculia bacterium]|nr:allantoate amidohydrolase [Thermoanaerobaculia bacterium]